MQTTMNNHRRVPSGAIPRPITINNRGRGGGVGGVRPPLPPPMFRFQPVKKEELEQIDALHNRSSSSQTRPPHPHPPQPPQPPSPPAALPRNNQHFQQPSAPSTSTAPQEDYPAETNALEYPDPQIEPLQFTLPKDCKVFEYTVFENGSKRVLLIPMPSMATLNDVKNLLSESLNVDPSTLDLSQIKEKLPTDFEPQYEEEEESEEESEEEYEEEIKEEVTEVDRKPILVNPKQFRRIIRRREMRQKLEDEGKIPARRAKYLHESRHRHALTRKRNTDGKFEGDIEVIEDEELDDEEEEDDESAVSSTVTSMSYSAPVQYVTQRFAPIAAAPHSQVYTQPIQQPTSNTQARYVQPTQQPTSSTVPSTSFGSANYGHQH